MKTVLLAIGNQKAEEAMKRKFEKTGDYQVIGAAAYKGAVTEKVYELKPDILLLQESLSGPEKVEDIVYDLRCTMPSVRIIFLTANEDLELLGKLVCFNVYDLLVGSSVEMKKIVEIMDCPRTLRDIHRYQTKEMPFSVEKVVTGIKEETQPEQKDKKPKFGFGRGIFGKGKTETEQEDNEEDKYNSRNGTESYYQNQCKTQSEELYAEEQRDRKSNFRFENDAVQKSTSIDNEVQAYEPESEIKPVVQKEFDDEIEEDELMSSFKNQTEKDSFAFSVAAEKDDIDADILKCANSAKENISLSEEDKELIDTMQTMQAEYKELLYKREEVEEKIESLSKERMVLFNKLSSDKDALYDLEKQIEHLEGKIKEKRENAEVDPVEKAQLENRIAILTNELDEIKGSSDFLTTKLNFLTACKRLYLFIDDAFPDEDCESPELYQKVIDSWKTEYKDMSYNVEELRLELINLNEKLKTLEAENISAKQSVTATKMKLSKQGKEKEDIQGDLAALQDRITELEAELEALLDKKMSMRSKIDSLNAQINQAVSDITELEKKDNVYETANSEALRKLNAEVEYLQNENSTLKEELNNNNTKETTNKLKLAENQLANLKLKITNLEKELQDRPTQEMIERIKREKIDIESQNMDLLKQIDTLKTAGGDDSVEMARALEESTRLKAKLEKTKNEYSQLSGECERLKAKVTQFETRPMVAGVESRITIDGTVYDSGIPRPKKTFIGHGKRSGYIPPRPLGKRIIAFLGSKDGVGNTYTALNVAALLARSAKVLYVEFDNKSPLSSYLFEFENITRGIEQAMYDTGRNRFSKLKDIIVIPKKKDLPDTLHFMTYSQMHLIDSGESCEMISDFDSLFRRIKIEGDYDYIIADFPASSNAATEELLSGKIYVDELYISINQNAHTIACAFAKLEKLKRVSETLAARVKIAVVGYNQKCNLRMTSISDWIDIKKSSVYPVTTNETFLYDAICEGQLYALIGDGAEAYKIITESLFS